MKALMRLANPFPELAIGELFETLLPDFVLAFAFFTALAYAVLGKRFDRRRRGWSRTSAQTWPCRHRRSSR
jgi:hypothetical protein